MLRLVYALFFILSVFCAPFYLSSMICPVQPLCIVLSMIRSIYPLLCFFSSSMVCPDCPLCFILSFVYVPSYLYSLPRLIYTLRSIVYTHFAPSTYYASSRLYSVILSINFNLAHLCSVVSIMYPPSLPLFPCSVLAIIHAPFRLCSILSIVCAPSYLFFILSLSSMLCPLFQSCLFLYAPVYSIYSVLFVLYIPSYLCSKARSFFLLCSVLSNLFVHSNISSMLHFIATSSLDPSEYPTCSALFSGSFLPILYILSMVSVSDPRTSGCVFDTRLRRTFFCGVFSPLTSAEACEKSSRWLWKDSCVSTGVRKSIRYTT